MTISDVLLVPARPLLENDGSEYHVLTKAVEVAPGIWLGAIDLDVATPVMKATSFRSSCPINESVMYGLVRHDPPGSSWDDDGELQKVLFLSHFVRATEAGLEHSARVERDAAGQIQKIYPADIVPPFARAYCCVGAVRRWLTQSEATTLRDVVAAYDAVRPTLFGTRLGSAISAYAEAPFLYQGRPRGLLLTTILEGLVSTMPDRATKQFVTRVPPLAAAVGMPNCDRAWAEQTYKLRSTLAHGASILTRAKAAYEDEVRDAFFQTLTDVDELLRRLLRTALLDNEFRKRLDEVDREWPVPAKGCPECKSAHVGLLDIECPQCKRKWESHS